MSSALSPLFLRILIRQAQQAAPDDLAGQKQFLEILISGHFRSVKSGDSTLISSTIEGKSVTFAAPSSTSKFEIMLACELALEYLENGILPVSEIYPEF